MTNSVLAYIDPGTGGIVLQMLAAGFFGALFAVKLFWRKIKGFFTGKKDRDEECCAKRN